MGDGFIMINFEEYKKEVLIFGKEIGWDFIFKKNKYGNVELLAPKVNNLKPLINWFSAEYVEQNKDWTPDLNWLKKKILK